MESDIIEEFIMGVRTMQFALAAIFLAISSYASIADTYVRGYLRSDGTYVQPHYRSNNDGNVWNNYSTRGNVNPYTGEPGTVDPYKPSYSYGSTLYPSYGGSLYGKRSRGW